MQEALLLLPPSDLKTLAASIRTGRLSPPYLASSLSRFLDSSIASAVAESLKKLTDSGTPPAGIAESLDLLALALTERPSIGDLLDLVVTGPSTSGAANRDTSVVVDDLFRNAEATVLLAGYAVYGGRRVFQALGERMLAVPNLKVRMFLDIQRRPGDTSASTEVVRRFIHNFETVEWPEQVALPEIYYDPRSLSLERGTRAVLHAKCVVVDGQKAFISSANFTEAAFERNVEVGLLLHSASIAMQLSQFFDSLLNAAHFSRAL